MHVDFQCIYVFCSLWLYYKKASGIFLSEVIAQKTITDWGRGHLRQSFHCRLLKRLPVNTLLFGGLKNFLILNTASSVKWMLHWCAAELPKHLSRSLPLRPWSLFMCSASFLNLVLVQILFSNSSDETLRNSFNLGYLVFSQLISRECWNFWHTL